MILVHSFIAYGHVGAWYFLSPEKPNALTTLVFVFLMAHIHTFMVVVLFLISGYFAHRSLERCGRAKFVVDKAFRLVPPTLAFMFALHPLINLFLYESGVNREFNYLQYLQHGEFLSLGPIWYLEELLLFCLILAILPKPRSSNETQIWSGKGLILLASITALVAFLVRLKSPLGLSLYNLELAYLPKNAAAFGIGALLAHRQTFVLVAGSQLAKNAGQVACVLGPIGFVVVYLLGGPIPSHGEIPYLGGWHYQAFLLSLWEHLTGIGLSLGVISLGFRKWSNPGPLAESLSRQSCSMLVIHAPILVGISLLTRNLHIPPLPFALAVGSASIVCTAATALVLGKFWSAIETVYQGSKKNGESVQTESTIVDISENPLILVNAGSKRSRI